MDIDVGLATATGKGINRLYEDRYRLLDGRAPVVRQAGRGAIYAVMDGVGGAPMGMAAAQLVADRLLEFITQPERWPASRAGVVSLIKSIDVEANSWGCIEGTDRPLAACAATIAWFAPPGLLADGGRVVLFHVGDAVGYRWDGTTLVKLTKEAGGQGNTLTNYIGMGPALTVPVIDLEFEEGDSIVLATDGVTKVLDLPRIAAAMQEPTPQRQARGVLDRARGAKTRDDVTVLVAELQEWVSEP